MSIALGLGIYAAVDLITSYLYCSHAGTAWTRFGVLADIVYLGGGIFLGILFHAS